MTDSDDQGPAEQTPPVDPDKMLHASEGHIKDADEKLAQSREDVDDANRFAEGALDE